MQNPWLNIPYIDYENHMNDEKVDQLRILSQVTKNKLELYKPESFAIIGCATGNGLEQTGHRL